MLREVILCTNAKTRRMADMKEDLAKLLTLKINEIKHNKTVVESIKMSMLEKYGVLRGETQRIFKGEVPIHKLEKNNLIRFVIELYTYLGSHSLNPNTYFTEKEILTAKIQESLKEDIEKFPITILNVIKHDDNTYVALVNARDIVRLYNSNLLEYNYNINKQYKLVKNVEGKMVQTIDIDSKKVKEIADKIVEGKYALGKMILNVLIGSSLNRESGQELEYCKDARSLIIHQAQVDIVDGLHDISALMVALNESPELELKVEVEVKHLDLDNIRKYFNKLNLKGGVN
jgi:hypothetical protein